MKNITLSLIALTFLTACQNDIKSSLGLVKKAPDEFTVISYPPLSVPPQLTLDVDKTYDENKPISVAYSKEESALLDKTKGNKHISDTKKMIDHEHDSKQTAKANSGLIRSAVRGFEDEDASIDPVKEKKRIEENSRLGKPINEGKIEYKEPKSTLDRILGR